MCIDGLFVELHWLYVGGSRFAVREKPFHVLDFSFDGCVYLALCKYCGSSVAVMSALEVVEFCDGYSLDMPLLCEGCEVRFLRAALGENSSSVVEEPPFSNRGVTFFLVGVTK